MRNKNGWVVSIPLTNMRNKNGWVVSSSPSLLSEGLFPYLRGG